MGSPHRQRNETAAKLFQSRRRSRFGESRKQQTQEVPLICSQLSVEVADNYGSQEDTAPYWYMECIAHRIVCLEAAIRFFYDQEYTTCLADDVISTVRGTDLSKCADIETDDKLIFTLLAHFERFTASLRIESVTNHFASQIVGVLHKTARNAVERGTKHSLLFCRGGDALVVHLASLQCAGSAVAGEYSSINYHHFHQQSWDRLDAASMRRPSPHYRKTSITDKMHPLVVFDPRPRPGQIQLKPCYLFFDSIAKCDEYIGSVLGGTHTGTLVPIYAFQLVRDELSPSLYAEIPLLPRISRPQSQPEIRIHKQETNGLDYPQDSSSPDSNNSIEDQSPGSSGESAQPDGQDICEGHVDEESVCLDNGTQFLPPTRDETHRGTYICEEVPIHADNDNEFDLTERGSRPFSEFRSGMAHGVPDANGITDETDGNRISLAEFNVRPLEEADVERLRTKIERLKTHNSRLQNENERLSQMLLERQESV